MHWFCKETKMKIKRRGFLGGLLSFAAFEKACMAEARVASPTDLRQDIEYWEIYFEDIGAIHHDKNFLEDLSWRWMFEYLLGNIWQDEYGAFKEENKYWWIDSLWNSNKSKLFNYNKDDADKAIKIIVDKYEDLIYCEPEDRKYPPTDEIKLLCDEIKIKNLFKIKKYSGKVSHPALAITNDMTEGDLCFKNFVYGSYYDDE